MATGKRPRLRAIAGGVGAMLSLALIATVFGEIHPFAPGPLWTWRVDPAAFLHAVPHQIRWLLPFLALCALQLPLRAVQWQATLRRPVPLAKRYHWVAIGAFVHNALPGKLGDVTRAWLLAREERFPWVESLGSVGVCKLLEFVALVGIAAVTSLSPAVPHALRDGLRIALFACAGLGVGVFALAQLAGGLSRALAARGGWPKLSRFLRDADAGLDTLKHPRALLRALVVSALPVLAAALGYALALHQMGIRGGWIGGPLVLLAIAVGQSVLVVPAGVGLYFVATSWAARAFGASAEQAALLATLTHIALLASQCGLGALSLWTRRISVDWLERAKAEASQAHAGGELAVAEVRSG